MFKREVLLIHQAERKRKHLVFHPEGEGSHGGSSSTALALTSAVEPNQERSSARARKHSALLQSLLTTVINTTTTSHEIILPALNPSPDLYEMLKDLYDKTRELVKASSVVDTGPFIKFFPCNHFINK